MTVRPTRALPLLAAVASGLIVLGTASAADATWSIVATDPASGETGVALASCVPAAVLGDPAQPLVPVVVVPGEAAAVSQGELNLDAPDRIRELVAARAAPADIVGGLADPAFDERWQIRQHAVASVTGDVAAFSGDELPAVAAQGQGYAVSAQGNLLASEQVIADSLQAFEDRREAGGGLAQALVDGLVAGSRAGGDHRCGDQTALFAQLVVAAPTDPAATPSTVLTVVVQQGDDNNPVDILASALADGRRGLVDVDPPSGRGGRYVQLGALAVGLALAVGALVFLRRGMGSVRARR